MIPDQRREQILDKALEVVIEIGLDNPRLRIVIAERLQISRTLVIHYFSSGSLRDEIIKRALDTENLSVIALGLNAGHDSAVGAPKFLKREALDHWAAQIMGEK